MARPVHKATRRAPRQAIGLAIAAVLTAAAAACGSEDPEASAGKGSENGVVSAADALGQETAGSVAQLAQCRDWNRGNEAEKLATIADIRSQVNLQNPGVKAPPLSDEEAMEVFDNGCKPVYAQGFRLYILYVRAAGFAPLVRD